MYREREREIQTEGEKKRRGGLIDMRKASATSIGRRGDTTGR